MKRDSLRGVIPVSSVFILAGKTLCPSLPELTLPRESISELQIIFWDLEPSHIRRKNCRAQHITLRRCLRSYSDHNGVLTCVVVMRFNTHLMVALSSQSFHTLLGSLKEHGGFKFVQQLIKLHRTGSHV